MSAPSSFVQHQQGRELLSIGTNQSPRPNLAPQAFSDLKLSNLSIIEKSTFTPLNDTSDDYQYLYAA